MKKSTFLLSILLFALLSCSKDKSYQESTSTLVQKSYINLTLELESAVSRLQNGLTKGKPESELHRLFFLAREAYKRVEHFAEYYNPATARSINGAALEKADEDDVNKTIAPEGFQVVEELMFPHIDTNELPKLRLQISVLVSNVHRLCTTAETIEMTDSHIFDALRLQVFRISTLGIAGFDTPLTFQSLN